MAGFRRFVERDRTLVVAHRGASRAARENTVEAFRLARDMGADAVELDVRRTADDAIVVHHDAEISGIGSIVELTLAELRDRAPHVPTLDEALAACEGMWVNVEIKNLPGDVDWDPTERLAGTAAAVLGVERHLESIVVSSFNPQSLSAVRERVPDLATALLTLPSFEPVAAVRACAEVGHVAVHPEAGSLTVEVVHEVVEVAAAAGVAVVPWTVDDATEIARLAGAGVAAVITNVPDVARKVVDS